MQLFELKSVYNNGNNAIKVQKKKPDSLVGQEIGSI